MKHGLPSDPQKSATVVIIHHFSGSLQRFLPTHPIIPSSHDPHLFPAVIRQEDAVALDALYRHLPTGVRLPKLQGTSHPAGPGIGVDEGAGAADLISQ